MYGCIEVGKPKAAGNQARKTPFCGFQAIRGAVGIVTHDEAIDEQVLLVDGFEGAAHALINMALVERLIALSVICIATAVSWLLASRELYWRNSMQEEFTCPKCSCQSIIYPDLPDDDDHVVCRTCGTFLGSVRQFRRFVERRPVRPGAAVTGC
jgi:hypothetical protein